MAAGSQRRFDVFSVLHAASSMALDAVRAEDDPADERLVAGLEDIVKVTLGELERLAASRSR